MKKLIIDNAEYLFSEKKPSQMDLNAGIIQLFILYHPCNLSIVIKTMVKYNGFTKTVLNSDQIKFIDSEKTETPSLEYMIDIYKKSCEQFGDFYQLILQLQQDKNKMLQALKSTRKLNLHQYDKGTVGNTVFEEIEAILKENK
jgi:hypothetical protein